MLFTNVLLTPEFDDRLRMRTLPGADKEEIDRQLWEQYGEEWCIMFTDLSGFSANSEKYGIIDSLVMLSELQKVLEMPLGQESGIILKTLGDGAMLLFKTVGDGEMFATQLIHNLRHYNDAHPDDDAIRLKVGIGFGKVLRVAENDIYGVEVNTTANLMDNAPPCRILFTEAAQKQRDPL